MKDFGNKLSDTVASFAGSWLGIITCVTAITLWILGQKLVPFDVKPYILLNLVLSISSALSGPFVMMSQSRKDEASQAKLYEILELLRKDLEETRCIKDGIELSNDQNAGHD